MSLAADDLKKEPPNVEGAAAWLLERNTWGSTNEEVLATVESDMADYEKYLLGEHVGDCTCVAATCMKCLAEDLLGINTIKWLGKHPGHHVSVAFRHCKTIPEAVAHLRDEATIKPTWKGYEPHVPRWMAEREHAANWLEEYQRQHFPNEQSADDAATLLMR